METSMALDCKTILNQLADRIGADTELRRELSDSGRQVELEAGQIFFRAGDQVDSFAVVTDGILKVAKVGEEGRELMLYTVGAGECCIINILCLLSDHRAHAEAAAEQDLVAVLYPRDLFRRWMAVHVQFQDYIHRLLSDRLGTMLTLAEEIAFHRMDQRLACYLDDRVMQSGSNELALTHETVAIDLGTAREVVSRLLKNLERRGILELARGRIIVLARDQLHELRD
ncbi:MAG: Crp/Fnr family transcriptional regulator [Acidimicrobiia bacterium]|nr:Crp/Fnr family transcriptional regulator [Acidimicrobiia bacterium]